MIKHILLISFIVSAICKEETARKPVYKYRYETEDVMKSEASAVPVRGYHVVEGGYYPEAGIGGGAGIGAGGISGGAGLGVGGAGLGIGGAGLGVGGAGLGVGGAGLGIGGAGLGIGAHRLIGYSPIGYGGFGIGPGLGLKTGYIGSPGLIGGGYSPGLIGGGLVGAGLGGGQFIGAPLYHHGIGGQFIDKNQYSGGKKNLNDESFQKVSGKKGEEIDHGKEGYSKGVAAVKSDKGESAYFNEQEKNKKILEDGKTYYGGQNFNKEGKNGGEISEKSGHKKGHKIKGFKTSHHKDESGKTEEYYDEEHDEGGKVHFNGQAGSFGEKGASSFKGGHENGNFAAGGHKKEGHLKNEHFVDNSNADQGKYGEHKYAGNGAVYSSNNGIDEHSLLGHQENSRFFKHHPQNVPFY